MRARVGSSAAGTVASISGAAEHSAAMKASSALLVIGTSSSSIGRDTQRRAPGLGSAAVSVAIASMPAQSVKFAR